MTREVRAKESEQNPEQLCVRIFARADGACSLYKDDNEGTGYEMGDCVFTDITFAWKDEKSLTIAPLFDFLNQAEMEFNKKTKIYNLVCREASKPELITAQVL